VNIAELHPDFWDIFKQSYSTLNNLRASGTTCRIFGIDSCNNCIISKDGNCILHSGYQPYEEFLKTFDQQSFENQYPEFLI